VLRDKATLRKPVWDDLKLLKGLLESTSPKARG
jgi:hypothetical protein